MSHRLKCFVFERYETAEKMSRNKKKPNSRFEASDELVTVYSKDTPGQCEERFGLSLDLIEAVKRVVKGEKPDKKPAPDKGKPAPKDKPEKAKGSPFPKDGDKDEEKPKTSGSFLKGAEEKAPDKKTDPTALDKKMASQDRERDMDSDDETASKIPSGKTPIVLNPEIDTSGQDDFSDKMPPTRTVGGQAKDKKRGSKKMTKESVENIEELSRKTMNRYKLAADSDANDRIGFGGDEDDECRIGNRLSGVQRANRLIRAREKKATKESIEMSGEPNRMREEAGLSADLVNAVASIMEADAAPNPIAAQTKQKLQAVKNDVAQRVGQAKVQAAQKRGQQQIAKVQAKTESVEVDEARYPGFVKGKLDSTAPKFPETPKKKDKSKNLRVRNPEHRPMKKDCPMKESVDPYVAALDFYSRGGAPAPETDHDPAGVFDPVRQLREDGGY